MLLSNFIDTEHGPAVLLATIVVILSLNLLFKVGTFAFQLVQKKQQVSEEAMEANTKAIEGLDSTMQKIELRLESVEASLSENPKMKTDLRRCFMAMKIIAGDDWAKVSKIITDDEYHS